MASSDDDAYVSLRSEIAEQPAVAERMISAGRPRISQIAGRLAGRVAAGEIRYVLIAARGTSDHAAIYAQYAFGQRLGIPVALAAPSLISLYHVEPRLSGALVVGISQSGRSPDIVETVSAARRQGVPTIAITNDPGSDLANAADDVIDLGAGPELAVAATKTYTAELVAIALLVAEIGRVLEKQPSDDRSFELVPDAITAALDAEEPAREVAQRLTKRNRLIVVGRGYGYATAREFALKAKELARLSADPYSAADFLHGPLALVEPGFPVILISLSGAAAEDLDALQSRLGELGVERIVISDRAGAVAAAEAGIVLPSGLPEWLLPIVSIVPGQLLAMHLAIARGIDPEEPRWIRKVTLTR
jgi:glucosamine--fructose-6-phosphate aminotransferase (isomerizing)